MKPWLIYGAYGYAGQLIVEEALRRGHRPVIAGRDVQKLERLGHTYGLDFLDFDLSQPARIVNMLKPFDLVLHAAGPFEGTSEPVLQACLEAGTHYVDITGEIPVFQRTFSRDREAKEKGIVLMSGAGFDVIPTDCLARFVAERTPGAFQLDLAFVPGVHTSPGTARTLLEILGRGGWVLREGKLQKLLLGQGSRYVEFPRIGDHWVTPIPWGDLVTAQYSTGIPNITTYAAMPQYPGSKWGMGLLQRLLSSGLLVKILKKLVTRGRKGPSAEVREAERWFVWACATTAEGKSTEAWLDLPEGYTFTARGSVLCVEKILASNFAGAYSPASAFGADLVLEIEGSIRLEGASRLKV